MSSKERYNRYLFLKKMNKKSIILIKDITTTENIKQVIDSELNKDFMMNVAEIYLKNGVL